MFYFRLCVQLGKTDTLDIPQTAAYTEALFGGGGVGWGDFRSAYNRKSFYPRGLATRIAWDVFFCLQGDEPITGRCLLVGRGGGGKSL